MTFCKIFREHSFVKLLVSLNFRLKIVKTQKMAKISWKQRFSLKLTKLFPLEVKEVFCNNKLHHDWWNFRQFDEIFEKKNIYFTEFYYTNPMISFPGLFSKLNKNLIARSLFGTLGCNGFATSLGMKWLSRDVAKYKTIASQTFIVQWQVSRKFL